MSELNRIDKRTKKSTDTSKNSILGSLAKNKDDPNNKYRNHYIWSLYFEKDGNYYYKDVVTFKSSLDECLEILEDEGVLLHEVQNNLLAEDLDKLDEDQCFELAAKMYSEYIYDVIYKCYSKGIFETENWKVKCRLPD